MKLKIGMIMTLLVCWGLGIPFLLYYKNHSVSYDEKSILVTDIYNRKKEFCWTDISEVKSNSFKGLLSLKTEKGVVKVHRHLIGFSLFREEIKMKTGL